LIQERWAKVYIAVINTKCYKWFILLTMVSQSLLAQDPYFSQFFNSILYLNPAYAGSAHQPRISAAYRNQMPALGSPWISYNASFDMSVKPIQGGIGINIQNDQQGPALNRFSADFMYSYFLALNNQVTIHAGFQASYSHRFLNGSSLVLPSQIDSRGNIDPFAESVGDGSKGYPDFAVGFVALSRTAYGGISMHHLTKPNLSLARTSPGDQTESWSLQRKLTVHGGVYIPVYEKKLGREALKLNPNVVYLHQGSFRQINYGMDIVYKTVYAGAWFRHSIDFKVNAFIIHLGYEHDYFRISYSHDFNVYSPWNMMQNMGAHELGLMLRLENNSGPGGRFRTIKSPKI
jgi:type IX secretion system PorP/SprF family membrane protein